MAKEVRVIIECVETHEVYTVNGKEVYKDSEGNFIAREELNPSEYRGFSRYRNNVISNRSFRVHTQAIYEM